MKLAEALILRADGQKRFEQLKQRVVRSAKVQEGDEPPDKTLSDALAERDVLVLRREAYSVLAQAAAVTQDRYSKSEVKFKSTVNVAEIQRQVDALAKAYRETDARIQEINWQTELSE